MLKATDVTKQFNTPAGPVTPVKDITIEVPTDAFAAIIGKSGSGKSTLLYLLGALDRPTSGAIEVDDQDIAKMSDQELTRFRRQSVGFVFQSFQLIPNLTAMENVMLPMEYAGVKPAGQKERAASLLDQVSIHDDVQHRVPTKLSGGEQQRVAIARALANKPKLILADEPTGNLDAQTGRVIIDLLHKLSKSENTTIIVVTHDLGLAKETDLTFQIKDGSIAQVSGKKMQQLAEASL